MFGTFKVPKYKSKLARRNYPYVSVPNTKNAISAAAH